jgi:hypothetical protein
MPADTYLTFQKFNDPALAEAIAEQLHAGGIDSRVENENALLDATLIGNDLGSTIHLKISPDDFAKANTVLENYYRQQIEATEPDYYLLSFTDEELMDIVRKPDEWGHFDHALAKKLLLDRGHKVTAAELEQFHQQRLTELKKPDISHPILIFLGYLTAIAGGLFGFVLGAVLVTSKKILPDGQRVFMYPLSERRHGRRILIISVISIILWVLLDRLVFFMLPL